MLVFVYGSLRRGGTYHATLAAAPFLGRWVTPAEWTMWTLDGYPAVSPGGGTDIVGEIYRIGPEILSELDFIEDYPELYQRQTIATPFGPAWIYVVLQPPLPPPKPILGGDWFDRD